MSRHVILIGTLAMSFVCSQAQAGEATATVSISARVNPFAEWCVSESPTLATTSIGGRSVRIEQTLKLFANTDVSLTLAPDVNDGILTCPNGDVLETVSKLTGDVELADRPEHGGTENFYRIRHIPGRGACDVTLDVRATLPARMTIQSAKCTASIQRAGPNPQRVDVTFEISASTPDLEQTKTYRCGLSVTIAW